MKLISTKKLRNRQVLSMSVAAPRLLVDEYLEVNTKKFDYIFIPDRYGIGLPNEAFFLFLDDYYSTYKI